MTRWERRLIFSESLSTPARSLCLGADSSLYLSRIKHKQTAYSFLHKQFNIESTKMTRCGGPFLP